MMLWHTRRRKQDRGRAKPGLMLRVTLAFVLFLAAFPPLASQQADAALPSPMNVSIGAAPNAIAVNEQTNKIYVADSNDSVTVIDGSTNAVLATIPVGSSPSAIALDKTRNIIYVANFFSNSVSVIDGATDTLATTISVNGGPRQLAVDSTTHTVYVAHYSDNTVMLIDGDSQAVTATVPISGTINGVVADEATNKAYVISSDGKVTVIGADRQTTDVNVGNKPVAIAVNETTNNIYAAIDKTGNGEVKVIDGATDTVTATLNAGSGPSAVVVDEATNAIYITNQGSASLTVIDGATNAASTVSLAAGSGPIAAAVDSGTHMIYVAHNSSYRMSVIDGGTLTVDTADTESASQVIAVNTETHKVYLLNASGKKVAVFYTLEDTMPPTVSFHTNGSTSPAPFASSAVTVTDLESGVDENSLAYAWSQSETAPDAGYWSFANGSDLDINAGNPNGLYYLYIKALDKAGNSITVRSDSFLLDSTAPAITITGSASETVNGPFPVSIVFSEAVNGFDEDDIEMNNGALSDFAAVDAMNYTAIVTPITSGEPVTMRIAADAAEDAAGNKSLESSMYSVLYDTVKPMVALGGFTANERFHVSPSSFTVTASEALYRISDSAAVVSEDASLLIKMEKDGAPFNGYTTTYDESALTYTVTFDGMLEDGDYTVDIAGGVVKNLRNNSLDSVSASFSAAVPVVSGISADPNVMSSEGGSVNVTVSGRHLAGQTIKLYRDGEEAAAADANVPEGAEAVVAIPANATTSSSLHRLTVFLNGTEVAGVSETVTVLRDSVLPTVHFGVNGNAVPLQSAVTAVTVDDAESGVEPDSLYYAWTQTADTPSTGWSAFASGDILKKAGADGNWYLHIQGQDTAGNTVNAVSNRFRLDNTAPVITLVGKSGQRMTAGGTYVEEGATATDAGGSGVAGAVAVSGSVNPKAPGTYTLRYNVSDLAGNAAAEVTRTVIVDADAPPPSSYGGSTAVAAKPVIDLNGTPYDPANIDTAKPSVTLEATPKNGSAFVSMPASILTSLEDRNATFFIEIKTPYGSYHIPVNLASLIQGLGELLAKLNLTVEDIGFKITLTDKSGDKELQAAFADSLPNGRVLGAMVDFHMDILNTKTDQPIGTADQFSKAITRVIPMPAKLAAMPERWGAFRYNETAKKLEFVPARTERVDGVWYVLIGSYSNSVYAVAENTASFGDVQDDYWGKPFIELAAAKGLVEGVGGGLYAPDKELTRAEFTTMLVKALGRGLSTGDEPPYRDIRSGAWYFGSVKTAKELGLIAFAQGDEFKPGQPITREEMASMLAGVIRLEKLPMTQAYESLASFEDVGKVGAPYLEDVRLMVELQIMNGTSAKTFDPQGVSTRAQAAAVYIRMLQRLGCIDK